jgi:hypothetical protein
LTANLFCTQTQLLVIVLLSSCFFSELFIHNFSHYQAFFWNVHGDRFFVKFLDREQNFILSIVFHFKLKIKENLKPKGSVHINELIVEFTNATQSNIVLDQTRDVSNVTQVNNVDRFCSSNGNKLEQCKQECCLCITKLIPMEARVLHHSHSSKHFVRVLKMNEAGTNKPRDLHLPAYKVECFVAEIVKQEEYRNCNLAEAAEHRSHE